MARIGVVEVDQPEPEPPDSVLWAAIRELPKRQAQAVVLTYAEDLSVADVAEILGCSPGAVKSHLSRGRQRLTQVLNEHRHERLSPGGADDV